MRRCLTRLVAVLCVGVTACSDDDASDVTPEADTGVDGTADALGGSGDAGPGADGDAGVAPVVTRCPDGVSFLWDPVGPTLAAFPDDTWTRPDTDTETGIRVEVGESTPWMQGLLTTPGLTEVFYQLSTLDGWGINAGIFLRFSGPIGAPPTGDTASVESEEIQLWELGETPVRVPFEAIRTDDDATLMLYPMQPLRAATEHLVLVTDRHPAADGGCIDPGDALAQVLEQRGVAGAEPVEARLQTALAAVGKTPAQVAAATLFTTQSALGVARAVAADVAERPYQWNTRPVCTLERPGVRICDGDFVAWDYRTEDGVAGDGTPQREYTLPVRIWLPETPSTEASGPWPIAVFGHGLGSGRGQGGTLARFIVPAGFATVAIDAVAHGDHPDTAGGTDELSQILGFFGLDPVEFALDGLILRDNFRQSTWDRLQLLELLAAEPDVDGDGIADLDAETMAYLGFSLGGIMGPELLALTDRFDAAVLGIPGGRVASIIEYASRFSIVIAIMRPSEAGQGDVDRFFPVLQTVVDAGDAATWAPYVFSERLPERTTAGPHTLMFMAVDDNTVPEPCNLALARALRIPTIDPVLRPPGNLPHAGAAPVQGNLLSPSGAERTVGLLQLDRETRDPGEAPQPSTHDYISTSVEGIHVIQRFIETWRDGLDRDVGTPPVIVNPYDELGTAPLAP